MRRDKKNKKGKKFGSQNKLTLFQKPEMKFGRSCPLSQKNSPIVDYKNIKLFCVTDKSLPKLVNTNLILSGVG